MAIVDGKTLFLLGSSHHRAPLEIREKFAFDPERSASTYDWIREIGNLSEMLLLSTCNRVEIYGVAEGSIDAEQLLPQLSDWWQLPQATVAEHSFWLTGEAVISHLFEVSSGLDSRMVGETEIFGQVKAAYAAALSHNAVGPILNRVVQRSFQAAKWVRTHSAIGQGRVSIGNVAAELATRVCGDLAGSKALLIGTGEVGSKTLQALLSRGADSIAIASRSRDRARLLAEQYHGIALTQQEALARIARVDIVLTATQTRHPILTFANIRDSMRKRPTQPLFLIDLAVPRNIEARCANLPNVYLYNIDHLGEIANENLHNRLAEVETWRQSLQQRAARLWKDLETPHQPTTHRPLK